LLTAKEESDLTLSHSIEEAEGRATSKMRRQRRAR
jgi:hypothetical protein